MDGLTMANMKISTKIFMIIVLLGAVCAAIVGVSISALSSLSGATGELGLASGEVRLGGRLNRLAIVLNRAEYQLAASPREYDEVVEYLKSARQEVKKALSEARATADASQQRLLSEVETNLNNYEKELDDTLSIAKRVKNSVNIDDQQRAVLKSVEDSREKSRILVESVLGYVSYTDDKGSQIAKDAAILADERGVELVAVAVIGVALGLMGGWLISRQGIVKPIRAIVVCLRGLAEGRLETVVYGVGRKDEVGEIADTANVFKQNLIRNREMERETQEAEERARTERRRATLELADRFEQRVGAVVNQVGSAATELQATAAQLAAAVEEVNAQSSTVAAASEEASASVQTVASASEEMAAAISELSRRVTATAGRSRGAAEGAESARRELDALSVAIEQVDQVVGAINAVASQTNLLALNATIEAARAGDAGKGFAVVAQEVKNLANQTHNMTGQIGGQIDAVKSASSRTVEAMRQIISQVGEIDQSTADMAASVEQQTAATGEISRNAQQAAGGVTQVSGSVISIQQAGQETGAASANVKKAADTLAGQSAMLKQEVDAFLGEVRAA